MSRYGLERTYISVIALWVEEEEQEIWVKYRLLK